MKATVLPPDLGLGWVYSCIVIGLLLSCSPVGTAGLREEYADLTFWKGRNVHGYELCWRLLKWNYSKGIKPSKFGEIVENDLPST